MKIKKPMKAPGAEGAAPGGAAIADRFRLDAGASSKQKGRTVNATAAAVAYSAGIMALTLLGFLVWQLFQHLQYMQSI